MHVQIKSSTFLIKKLFMKAIKDFSQLDLNGHYSYADYLTWKFEQAIELIRGKVFKMAAPSTRHQVISRELTLALGNHFKHHKCQLFAAPFDVRLFDKLKSLKTDKNVYTVIQPDLCIICDLQKLDTKGCLGAPDLIVEILSPGNSKREMKIKKDLYAESGVREYWIVDPTSETVSKFNVEGESVFGRPYIFVSDELMPSTIFPDFILNLNELFPNQECIEE